MPDDTRIVFDTRYLRCKCRSHKLRVPYIFGSLAIENSIDEIGDKALKKHIVSSQDAGATSRCQVIASDWELSILILYSILNVRTLN